MTKLIIFPNLPSKIVKKTPKIPKKRKHGQISHGPASTFWGFPYVNFRFWVFNFWGVKRGVTKKALLARAHYVKKSLCIYTGSEGGGWGDLPKSHHTHYLPPYASVRRTLICDTTIPKNHDIKNDINL
jgi:hypothetical protein